MAGRDRGHETIRGPPRRIVLKGRIYLDVKSRNSFCTEEYFLKNYMP